MGGMNTLVEKVSNQNSATRRCVKNEPTALAYDLYFLPLRNPVAPASSFISHIKSIVN